MKKYLSGILTGVILTGTVAFASQYVADVATFKVMVNGNEFKSDKPVVAIEGSTYLPLKAIGEVLGVPVQWNEELRQVEIGISQSSVDYYEVENFIIGEVWNNGFWWIENYLDGNYVDYTDMYIGEFASSHDEEFDIKKIEECILKTKSTIEEYNLEFINNEKWTAFYNEYNRLYEMVENVSYTEDNFNTAYFTKVRDEFCDTLNN